MQWFTATIDDGIDEHSFNSKLDAMIHVGADKCKREAKQIYCYVDSSGRSHFIGTKTGLWIIGFDVNEI